MAPGSRPLLFHGGSFTFLSLLYPWARMQGGEARSDRLVIPNMETGAYSVCIGSAAVSKLRQGGEPPAASCASGALVPYGELVLRASEPGSAR